MRFSLNTSVRVPELKTSHLSPNEIELLVGDFLLGSDGVGCNLILSGPLR